MQMLEISPGKETNYKPEVSNIYAIHPTEFFFFQSRHRETINILMRILAIRNSF